MAKGKKADAEVEEITDADVEELEELDSDAEEEAAPAKESKKGAASTVTFGVADLVALIKEKTGKDYSTRDVRTLIRRMAREDTPRVEREVIAGNRSRYDWPKGAKDPEVKAIIAAITGGEVEAARKETLDNLKKTKADKKAKGEGGKKGKGKGKNKDADDE